ncbi:MAG: hypothetical protein M1818_006858 [Claussenomyces sp. TS43310]|nr:MAG: hypothetical protein M1818_006858 [Claussenomyces sp. TS43310]
MNWTLPNGYYEQAHAIFGAWADDGVDVPDELVSWPGSCTEFSSPDGDGLACARLEVQAYADDIYLPVDLHDQYILTKEIYHESLDNFKGKSITVEASHYLQRFLDTPPYSEPLLPALGGYPLALRTHIEADLDKWSHNEIAPFFVFEGQSIVGKEERTLEAQKTAVEDAQLAWGLYSDNKADRAVSAFGASGAVGVRSLYHFFQEILVAKKVKFLVAPYSACAQAQLIIPTKIAFLDSTEDFADGVMGSLETLLYDMHKDSCLITNIDFDKQTASGVVKSDLLRKLHVSEDTFIDCLLMLGTSFLPTFPILKDRGLMPEQPPTVKNAINMFRAGGGTINSLCQTFSDGLQKDEPQWEDKYRKAKMSIKHSIVATSEGEIEVRDYKNLTSDAHEFLGLQLPAELNHYLLHAAIGPRAMKWLSSSKMLLLPPLDGGSSEDYRHLITHQLNPIREQTLAVYTARMHRAFQFKKVSVKVWFDDSFNVELDHHNFRPIPQDRVRSWSVRETEYKDREAVTNAKPTSLASAILMLEDETFATSTISTGPKIEKLESTPEIIANVLWRFLHLRGYVGDDHKLTRWGLAFAAAIKELGPAQHLDEAAFLAIELLRYNQLNAQHRHEEWIGGPQRGSEADKTSCLLIARSACLVKLRHKAIGYTGPLSKNLLAHHSIISAVRQSDRDLIEAILASLFLHAEAQRLTTPRREPDEFTKLGLSLPFNTDVDVGLGIAVKTYLDDHSSPTFSPAEKETEKKAYAESLIPHNVNFAEDLALAFRFFDALYAAVRVLGTEVADQAVWKDASEYLAKRR